MRSDDRVAAENYYQHAEHYLRISNESRGGNLPGASRPIDRDSAPIGFVAEPGEIATDRAPPQTDDDQPWPITDHNR
jgi:Domain of unknown function (DUF4167)